MIVFMCYLRHIDIVATEWDKGKIYGFIYARKT